MKRAVFILISLVFLFSSCQKRWCLECVDVRFGDYFEQCNDDLELVEQAAEEWTNLGYICNIFENS